MRYFQSVRLHPLRLLGLGFVLSETAPSEVPLACVFQLSREQWLRLLLQVTIQSAAEIRGVGSFSCQQSGLGEGWCDPSQYRV